VSLTQLVVCDKCGKQLIGGNAKLPLTVTLVGKDVAVPIRVDFCHVCLATVLGETLCLLNTAETAEWLRRNAPTAKPQ
jgi:hypothetical protein